MGRFTKTLSRPVRDIMNVSPVVVRPDSPATRVRRLFRETGARVVYVTDRDGRLLGWITRGDILSLTSSKSMAVASQVMSDPPVVLDPSTTVSTALRRMLDVGEWYAPILEAGRLKGSLGLEEVIASMVEEDPDYLASIELSEIMTSEVVVASPDDPVWTIWAKMVEYKYSGIPVVDSKGRLVGIVTTYDLLAEGARPALEASGGPGRGAKVREFMTSPAFYLYPWSRVSEAAETMVKKGYGRIPIVESERTRKLAGIVDREDIVSIALDGGR